MMVKWSSFACAGFTYAFVCVFNYRLQESFEGYNWDYKKKKKKKAQETTYPLSKCPWLKH